MKETSSLNHHYNDEYVKLYLDRTLSNPYTINKARLLANTASKFNIQKVLDLGSNVHGSIQTEGSLRFQMNQKGIDYVGIDLSPKYFDQQFIAKQNISKEIIYPQIKGVVGDLLELPTKSSSVEMVVCSDVLEHICDPVSALKEIHRVLNQKGLALVILPSLYKLDMLNLEHISQKRKSSHLEKTSIDEWIKMCRENGLEVDEENSMAVGVSSGLSYLSWMDEKFIPERLDLSEKEIYSPDSLNHKEVKNVLAKYDEQIDLKIHLENKDVTLVESLKNGDIKKIVQILKEVVNTIILDQRESQIVTNFFDNVADTEYESSQMKLLKNTFLDTKFPKLLIGNSTLLVLKKK